MQTMILTIGQLRLILQEATRRKTNLDTQEIYLMCSEDNPPQEESLKDQYEDYSNGLKRFIVTEPEEVERGWVTHVGFCIEDCMEGTALPLPQ